MNESIASIISSHHKISHVTMEISSYLFFNFKTKLLIDSLCKFIYSNTFILFYLFINYLFTHLSKVIV